MPHNESLRFRVSGFAIGSGLRLEGGRFRVLGLGTSFSVKDAGFRVQT